MGRINYKKLIIGTLLILNVTLLIHFLIWTQPIALPRLVVVSALVGLAFFGLVGLVKANPKWVYIYAALSFFPIGFYLLMAPSIYRLIGVINIAVLTIQNFLKEN